MGRPPQDFAEGPLPLSTLEGENRPWRSGLAWLAIGLTAVAVRFHDLGGLSFWYDEVVTMTLARAPGPAALLDRLAEIDATRAPLHPLLLQGWLRAFGASEAAGRSFSALCGAITVGLIGRLALRIYGDMSAARWAAALAALSPLLVYYSREARMYAWLVLLTCLAWDVLFSLGTRRGQCVYALSLAALGYSHPLGLLMAATLALGSLVLRRSQGLSWRAWLLPHLFAGLVLAPWLPRYFDHPPEYAVGRLPIKFLLGTPIGFVGGNFLTLGALGLIVAWGVRGRACSRLASWLLLTWLSVPPAALYLYSLFGHPIFGPNRYTLFVAPAFLILIAGGLTRLPCWLKWPAGVATLALSAVALPSMVFAPGLKADWRAAVARLDEIDPGRIDPVIVVSPDPSSLKNLEVETARYYLGATRSVAAMPADPRDLDATLGSGSDRVWFAVGPRGGEPSGASRGGVGPADETIDVPGLRLFGGTRSPTTPRPSNPPGGPLRPPRPVRS